MTSGFPQTDHDACGVGFLADLQGRPLRDLLPQALTALARMAHRGAVDADGRSGDGAGVLTQIPFDVFVPDLLAMGLGALPRSALAVGSVFLSRDPSGAALGRRLLEGAVAGQGLAVCGWRAVPVDEEALGPRAALSRPQIAQVVVERPPDLTGDEFERRLYRARRHAESRARAARLDDFYVASLSHRSIVYKALVRGGDLADFYADLRRPEFATAFAVFHQRFSTNTSPSWEMAQPFRVLAHNGEINTIDGNRSWMRAREPLLRAPLLELDREATRPLLAPGTSDSASLDEALALIALGRRNLLEGLTLLVPPAWENDSELPASVRALFEYQSCLMEPWDGPACVAFTDGQVVGAALDRNGLRPARTLVTTDGLVLVASEAGVFDVEEHRVLGRGRLGPGELLAVDLRAARLLDRETILDGLARRRPYARWLAARRVHLGDLGPGNTHARAGTAADPRVLGALGYTREELLLVLGPMHTLGVEPLGSMGDDTPLAVLSEQPRLLFSSFKQRFAQVTNPPLDPLREALVMSLAVDLGPRGDLLGEGPAPGVQVHAPLPLLTPAEIEALEAWQRPGWRAERLSLLFPIAGGVAAFKRALDGLLDAAAAAVRAGATLLVLSDRGIDAGQAALPSLLAVSAVHQRLVRDGLRLRASLAAEVGEARDDHQVAALIGFGAEVVCPYLAFDVIAQAAAPTGEGEQAQSRYVQALRRGLLKILAKMGIATVRSYHGAQLFEAVGVADELVERHFTGTPSFVGGVGLAEIARDVLARHARAFAPRPDPGLEEGGLHRYRRNGERHAYAPGVVKALHASIRSGERLDYRRFADLVHARPPLALRDLLDLRESDPIDVADVEPVEALLPRFMTAAMSLGAISPEAQQVLAIAMNRMGARSNSGEGGEPAELAWAVLPRGDQAGNRVKQVASARFGVTAEYLCSASELQIKMAQGSKPGEGGQLPAHKVTPYIARVRRASPGITLISPPPHHDIYSIEDLAQLVYDLRRVNPGAAIGVKLVSSAGIGTVAAGVVKAQADAVQVSGHDGGTGASPLGSIKNAGTPWEMGLAEVQQSLVRNGLRARVRLQVDGGLKTGRDVVVAALLGADEFAFGTAALVAAGCVMARQCHLNTCPAGIATQREDLRARFRAQPEDVVHFFRQVAEEVREILALLGAPRLDDVIGRVELLQARALPAGSRAATVRLDHVLAGSELEGPRRWSRTRQAWPDGSGRLDEAVLAHLHYGLRGPGPLRLDTRITNADRAVGARIAGELTRRYRGRLAMPEDTLDLAYRGSAGQSFGAFCVEGMRLELTGEANDFVGKGMSGGEIVVRPGPGARTADVIAGNTLLYGATGGRAFIAGRVGERFAVRNSGAVAVVEGTGDHACEYMTAGAVVILGPTGRNVGAGMSGGLAYVLDEDGLLQRRHNPEMVALSPALTPEEEAWLRDAVVMHAEATGSRHAQELLDSWSERFPSFRRLRPRAALDAVATPAALRGSESRSARFPR